MYTTNIGLAILFAILRWSSAQSPFRGKCPSPLQYQTDFDATKYFVGKWYEQRRFFAVFESGQKCVEAQYSLLPSGTVQVNNSGVLSNGTKVLAYAAAYCDTEQPAKCFVRFEGNQHWSSYNVLATDYSTFSVVYACKNGTCGRSSTQVGWILTRQRQVDYSVVQLGLAVLARQGVDTSQLLTTAQDCP